MSIDNSQTKIIHEDIDETEIKLSCLVQDYKSMRILLHSRDKELSNMKNQLVEMANRECLLHEDLTETRNSFELLGNTVQNLMFLEEENKTLKEQIIDYKSNLEKSNKVYSEEIERSKLLLEQARLDFNNRLEEIQLKNVEIENFLEANMRCELELKNQEISRLKCRNKELDNNTEIQLTELRAKYEQARSKCDVLEEKLKENVKDIKCFDEYKSELSQLKIKYETETRSLKNHISKLVQQLKEVKEISGSNIKQKKLNVKTELSHFHNSGPKYPAGYRPIATTTPIEKGCSQNEQISNTIVAYGGSCPSTVHDVPQVHQKFKRRKLMNPNSITYSSDHEGQ